MNSYLALPLASHVSSSSSLSDLSLAPDDPLAWLDDMADLHQHSTGLSPASPGSLYSPSPAAPTPPRPARPAASTSRSPHPPRSDEDGYSSSSSQSSAASSSRKAKKSKIALHPTQPLTAKGKPRARVYVACHECRSRKIRCDGAKPVCFNCHRRDPAIDRCDYDGAPRRRGQDKVPGSRTRSAVGQRAPRRQARFDPSDSHGSHGRFDPDSPNPRWKQVKPPLANFEEIISAFDPSNFDIAAAESYQLPPLLSPEPDDHDDTETENEAEQLPSEPSMHFARETWWDALLTFYASQDKGRESGELVLSTDERLATTQLIFTDIRALLRASVYWASFLHLPRFFETILEPDRRTEIQPGLFLSMLAIGAYAQSSELKGGAKGRKRALKLMDLAHSAIQASLNSHWVDTGLVQAAWFITYFEMQGHPAHSHDRCRSSMLLLDSLIRVFSLTALDADRPAAHYSIFGTYMRSAASDGSPPSFNNAIHGAACSNVYNNAPINLAVHTASAPDSLSETPMGLVVDPTASSSAHVGSSCNCAKYTLKEQWPTVSAIAPPWEATTMWPNQLSEGEIQKEESRRLVWSSVMLTAGHNSFGASVEGGRSDNADLFIRDYRNFALFFPGQTLCVSGITPVHENNVWNLCLRAMLLWHTSARYRHDETLSAQEKARFAMNAWLEADAIEAALDGHTCNLEAGMMHQAREFLFTSRMAVSHEFKRFAPEVYSNGMSNFYRAKAEGWLRRQVWVTEKLWEGLHNDPNNELSRRPMLVWWFMSHIARALTLWKSDPTLVMALEACKSFARPLEYLLRLWPSQVQRDQWQRVRYELVNACLTTGVQPPANKLPPSVKGFKAGPRSDHSPSPSRTTVGTL